MPVVVVHAAPLPSRARDIAAAGALAAAIAAPLELRPTDVYVTLSPVATAVLGHNAVPRRPVVLIHGRRRTGEQAALLAAGLAAADSWGTPVQDVWVQWVRTDPIG